MAGTNHPMSRWNIYLSAGSALFLTIAILRHPEAAFSASLEGLKIWFDIVLPALLPFFAMSEILMGLGVVHFIGVLLEPLMRPLFRIPGVGAFAVAMGLASGYPIGAKITAQLRRQGLCNSTEGERLVSFANTADPLFMVGAVAIGMFGIQEIGWTITAAHYLSVVVVGFLMRFLPEKSQPAVGPASLSSKGGNILSRAFKTLEEARMRDGRAFGQLFGDAIRETLASMLFIGGCIMVFSVLGRILDVSGATKAIQQCLALVLRPLGVSDAVIPPLLRGIIEITIGCEAISQANASLLVRTAVAGFIIGWSGLSVHTQVATMIRGTDIRLGPYIAARMLHGILAAVMTVLVWRPVAALATSGLPMPFTVGIGEASFLSRAATSLKTAAGCTALLVTLGLILNIVRSIRIIYIRIRP
ncbi:MAG TPA: sporulation integral membrane protein YlbJ [Firmicutes bacterium]|nr:sporulation integral membrane protein YlbJ [Bacillota bacterium]